jgi:hypothetical protein
MFTGSSFADAIAISANMMVPMVFEVPMWNEGLQTGQRVVVREIGNNFDLSWGVGCFNKVRRHVLEGALDCQGGQT